MVELLFCAVLVSSRYFTVFLSSAEQTNILDDKISSVVFTFTDFYSYAFVLFDNQVSMHSLTPGVVELLSSVVLVSSRALPHLVWLSFSPV